MKIAKLIGFVVILASPIFCQAVGLEDAATGMAKNAAQDAAKSTAKDAAKSMVPKSVSGAATSANDAAKTAQQAKKMTALPGTDKASKAKTSKEETQPFGEEEIPAGE